MNEIPCTAKPEISCEGCDLNGPLMCRYEKRDTLHFFVIFLPLLVTSIGGMIASGFGWWLFGWLGYMLFFFNLWESKILCSHCPYWAEEGRVLHCHANYGIFKIWKYNPRPMNRSEQVQFLIGAAILVFFPVVFMIAGAQYLLAGIGFTSAVSFGFLLWRNICDRCVNFSCPLNHVPEKKRQAFFERNELIAQAWKEMKAS